MSTLTEREVLPEAPAQENGVDAGNIIRRAGRLLLQILGALAALLSLLPVILLPLITSVPLALCLLLALVDVGLIAFFFTRADSFGARAAIVGGLVAVSLLAVVLSQWFASTPPISDAGGDPIPGSVATLERVELNGRNQWISIRGHNVDRPVLLFLAGGPGGSQLAATRKNLAALEESFVVVNWDQPGVGKSYHAADFGAITPEQYVEDAHALTLYLRERFGAEKIYLLGESWGSLLGVWLVQRYPDLYHATVGVAQMVAFTETDTYNYELALEIAAERGDSGKVQALEQQGPPPYYGDGVAMKVAEYIMYLSSYMAQNPNIGGPGYDTLGDIAASEYGLYDKVNYARGLLDTMNHVYPQLWQVDLRQQAPRLEAPVYFLEGRHDVNAPPALAESYYDLLEAPHKALIWFEHSGHSPWIDESAKLNDVLVNTVLRETYQ